MVAATRRSEVVTMRRIEAASRATWEISCSQAGDRSLAIRRTADTWEGVRPVACEAERCPSISHR